MTDLTDVTVSSLTIGSTVQHEPTTQALVANGAITIKHGVVTMAKTVPGALAITLANPTATTDDYKVLTIISAQAQANTVACAGGFGNGGAGEVTATFGGAIGDCMIVMAYQGYWYIIGKYNVVVA